MITDIQVADFFEAEVMDPNDSNEQSFSLEAMIEVAELAKAIDQKVEDFIWHSFYPSEDEDGEERYWLKYETWFELGYAWRKFAKLTRVYRGEEISLIPTPRLYMSA